MSLLGYIILFSIISGVFSLIGGIVLLYNSGWVRKFSIHFISFAAGALLAVSFLDILPEAFEMGEVLEEEVLFASLLGIVLLFGIERLILFRFHAHADDAVVEDPHRERSHAEADAGHAHHHATPILLNIGDGFHNFIDGAVVAAAFLVSIPLGMVAALSVAVHEIPQEIGDFSVMLHHGWAKSKVLWINFLVSLANLVGAVAAYAAREIIEPFLPQLLGFTAGIFIYIAASDLLPALADKNKADKPSHVYGLLLFGIFTVWFIGRLVE